MILAFDPGVTTGWCAVDTATGKYSCGELGDDLLEIFNFMNRVRPNEVVFEMFRYRPGQGHALLYSVQVIAIIRLWCQMNDIKPESYVPAETKKYWTDAKIKHLGLWITGKPHGMDAMRALLRYRLDYDKTWAKETNRKLRIFADRSR